MFAEYARSLQPSAPTSHTAHAPHEEVGVFLFDRLGCGFDCVHQRFCDRSGQELKIVHVSGAGYPVLVYVHEDNLVNRASGLHALQLGQSTAEDANDERHWRTDEGEKGLGEDRDEDVLPGKGI